MPNLNYKANFAKGFKKDPLMNELYAAGGAVGYRVIPSLLNLEGKTALLVGFGIPYLAGKAFDMPGLCTGAMFGLVSHLLQYAEPTFTELTGKKFWRLEPEVTTPALPTTNTFALPEEAQSINDGMQYVVRPGEDMYSYSRSAVEAMAQNPGLDGVVAAVTPQGNVVRERRSVVDAASFNASSSLF